MITPPTPPAVPALPMLEILDAGNLILYSAPLYQEREGTVGLNRQVMQADENDDQTVSGDARTLIGTITHFIRVEGDLRVQRKLILDALRNGVTLRLGLVTQTLAGGIRIASETPVGRGTTAWKFGLEVAPETATSTDGATEGVGLW